MHCCECYRNEFNFSARSSFNSAGFVGYWRRQSAAFVALVLDFRGSGGFWRSCLARFSLGTERSWMSLERVPVCEKLLLRVFRHLNCSDSSGIFGIINCSAVGSFKRRVCPCRKHGPTRRVCRRHRYGWGWRWQPALLLRRKLCNLSSLRFENPW